MTMLSTMQDYPLTVSALLRHGARLHGRSEVVTLGESGSQVAKWWLPERWVFVDEVPKTSVGKFDKKTLRKRHAEGLLEVVGSTDG